MSADLDLTCKAASSNPNTVLDLSGEYCFGQDGGWENATRIDGEGLAVPITPPAGHLVELYGDLSDSTFDGTNDNRPLPTGWRALIRSIKELTRAGSQSQGKVLKLPPIRSR
jgi:hypothetical protein